MTFITMVLLFVGGLIIFGCLYDRKVKTTHSFCSSNEENAFHEKKKLERAQRMETNHFNSTYNY